MVLYRNANIEQRKLLYQAWMTSELSEFGETSCFLRSLIRIVYVYSWSVETKPSFTFS